MPARLPGDYLGVNANAEHEDGQHSQMFLAWDATAKVYWYVEGNGSYTSAYGDIVHTVNVESHDACDNDGWWSPLAAAAECGVDDGFWIKTIGTLNEAMVE
ncbi:MAG: hypothetical protein ACKV2T_08140 [Kofleriaceae bacterium]